ncbi:MAG: hypothetical protein U0350_32485 [Caldilineaceae bacterium]
MSALEQNLAQLCTECKRERADFRAGRTKASPACVELFRRAFAQDTAAWNAIFGDVFAQDIKQFVQAAYQEYVAIRGFAPFALEDAVQETTLAFWRYAPQDLLDSGQLEPIVVYLKKCAKSGVALAARRNREQTIPLTQLAGEEEQSGTDESTASPRKIKHPVQTSFEELLVERQVMIDELRKLVTVDPEPQQAEVVVIECFLNELPPRELPNLHPQLFTKTGEVNTVLQRIRRRAEKQPYFRRLLGNET